MNKIRIVEDVVEELKITKKISFSIKSAENEFDITSIDIICLKSCDLELDFLSSSKRWKINIQIQEGITVNLYLYQKLENSKVQYNYQIHDKSKLFVFKFQKVPAFKEMVEIHLEKMGASIEYSLKDICTSKETIDYRIYHNAKNTNSNIKNNIVSLKDGKATIQVSTFIPKGMKESIANQSNRIISLNEKKNEIRPNLYIDEYDVIANHSALIGNFTKEEMFYLQSRGIPKEEASRLLLKGFLLSDITNKKMQKQIELATKEEWR